ncbi:MAG TPA: FG-GAP-like repeat-containing protein [Phycisphaerales bacterium]|nr:FG-GAP-like repeat-containing protein [Phycisphaerales bacterium]
MPTRTAITPAILAALAAAHAQAQCTPSFNNGPDLLAPAAFAIAVADVNMDGRPDIITAPNTPGPLSVFRNLGGGVFSPRLEYGFMSANSRHIAIADITVDGIPDVAVTTDQGLELYYNFVNTFHYMGMEHTGQLRQVASADMDGDGTADLVTACATPSRVDVLLNPGGGFLQTFSTAMPVPANGVLLTDFTFDGRPDAIIMGAGNTGLYALFNDGNGHLINPQLIINNVGGNAIAAADLNSDGQVDIVNMQPNFARANVLVNQGGGTFGAATPINTSSSGLQWLPAIADINGDNTPELILPYLSRVNVYQQTGPFAYVQPPLQFPTGAGAAQVAVGDFNDDGAPDLAVSNPTAGTIRVLFNAGGGTINLHPQPAAVEFGGNASFEIAATTTGPVATYQWRRNGQFLTEGDHYAGVHTNQLHILSATEIEAGTYDCVINACGQVYSNPATLTVTGCPSADYNRDGDVGTDADIEAFFRILGGGPC